MIERYFVDSNVLIYARDLTEPAKQKRADLWTKHLWAVRAARLSYQVLAESYAVLTSPQKRRMTNEQARVYVTSFEAWLPIPIDQHVLQRAWTVQDRFEFSWWDSLIVAAAQLTQCNYLLTEDLQHAQDLDGLVVINPFETEPEVVQG
jgi:predicted nucleic acid-binding protein